jgi:hypothetical protein
LDQGIKEHEECGSRYLAAILEGCYKTTVTIERFYSGSGPWAWMAKGENPLDYMDIQIWPNRSGSAAGLPYITISGLKLSKATPSYRPGSTIFSETWDFIGTGSVVSSTT